MDLLGSIWDVGATVATSKEQLRRAELGGLTTRTKNRIRDILRANLIPPYPGNLFGALGRSWLAEQPLVEDEKLTVQRHLADLDHRATDLAALDQALAMRALEDERVRR